MLSNKLDELEYEIHNNLIDIALITEVKPKNSRYIMNLPEYKIKGFTTFGKNIESKEGRGIIIYIKDNIARYFSEVIIGPENDNFQEMLWVQMIVNNITLLTIGCFYRSPNSTEINNSKLNECILNNCKINKQTLIVGDFNYKNINWETWRVKDSDKNSTKQNFLNCLQDKLFDQHINEPTRCRGDDIPSLLDLLLTNHDNIVNNVEIISPIANSDHAVITFDLLIEPTKLKSIKLRKNYNKANYGKMREELKKIQWNQVLVGEVEEKWNIFKYKLSQVVDNHLPLQQIHNGVHKLNLSVQVRKMVKKKHGLWKKYMRTKAGQDYREFCKTRNKVKNLVKKARKDREREIARSIKINPKSFWQYIKSKTSLKVGVSPLMKNHDVLNPDLTKTDAEKAEVLLNYFSSVYTKEPDSAVPELPQINIANTMLDLKMTEEMIKNLLYNINISKSGGEDDIHPRILRELADELSYPIKILFTDSLRLGKLPSDWKKARLSAIFKKGKKIVPNNYRPVSLTCILCKNMEKLIRDHIYKHMEVNNLFSKNQFGFMHGRSTSLQLLKVLNDWTTCLEKGSNIHCAYMDFQKAFDTVPHKRLLYKIQYYGIKDPIYGWLKEFLTGRTQYVKVNESKSKWGDVVSGIPQGSVLGPLLFVIYINDLPNIVDSKVYLFADDTKLYKEINNIEDSIIFQNDLDKVNNWSNKWLLRFHPDKCKIMKFGKKEDNYIYNLTTNNIVTTIKETSEEKDLGVTFDQQLSFETHIHNKIATANKMFNIIRRSYKFLDVVTFIPLYKSMVRSHLDYASTVWHPMTTKLKDDIESVQRRATKQIPSLKHLSYPDRLKKLNLPTLAYRKIRGDIIEAYKIVSNIYDESVTNNILDMKCDQNERASQRGHKYKLVQNINRTKNRKYYFTSRIVKIWNGLPQCIIYAPSVNSFKSRLDRYWQNQPLFYNYQEVIETSHRWINPGIQEHPIEDLQDLRDETP
jgi:hypothetical protein